MLGLIAEGRATIMLFLFQKSLICLCYVLNFCADDADLWNGICTVWPCPGGHSHIRAYEECAANGCQSTLENLRIGYILNIKNLWIGLCFNDPF